MPIVLTEEEIALLLPLLEDQPRLKLLRQRLQYMPTEARQPVTAAPGDYLSAHFKRSEFACHCGCGKGTISPVLIRTLETIRAATGGPIIINSGYRCIAHNRRVGGAKNSQHCLGNAADIVSPTYSPESIARMAERILGNTGGVGRYKRFTHVDTRPGTAARWTG